MNGENKSVRMVSPTKIEITRVLPASPSRVWEYLVDPDLRQQWFCSGRTGCRPGEEFVMDFDHSRLSSKPAPVDIGCGDPVTMIGTIVTFDPPRELSYSWPDGNGGPGTLVTIRLFAKDEETELSLVHERLTNPEFLKGASAGWHAHLDLLVDLVNGKPPRDFWDHYTLLKNVYDAEASATT